ncbi:MAG: hypothetical protein KBS81_06480 [Spirochaetales bacterium]|nr:hypothetical protein [Candidatus Physcosoma equi]
MIVTVDQFNAYSGNYEDKASAVEVKKLFLESAEEIVEGYLGYDPEAQPQLELWGTESLPASIKLSILRIATLMLQETGGNIGLTGKSFADNSRTFINYSNYRKYLQPLDPIRLARF